MADKRSFCLICDCPSDDTLYKICDHCRNCSHCTFRKLPKNVNGIVELECGCTKTRIVINGTKTTIDRESLFVNCKKCVRQTKDKQYSICNYCRPQCVLCGAKAGPSKKNDGSFYCAPCKKTY